MKTFSDWAGRRFFNLVHGNSLVYNTCWEDPRLDRIALNITPEDNIMMITSAGCNALDYALDEPNHIYCVDMNPRQNYLLELKQAGIKSLDYAEFFQIFGTGVHPGFPQLLESKLEPHLSLGARKYWRKNAGYFAGSGWRPSFYYRGTSGLMARMLGHYIDLRSVRDAMNALWETASVAEQKQIYEDAIRPRLWTDWFRLVSENQAAMTLLGVPKAQLRQLQTEYVGGFSKFVEDCIEAVFTRIPMQDNYFWWLYYNGAYTPKRCPEYLKEDNFYRLKDGLVDSISTHTMSLAQFMNTQHTPLSKFVLLDHMDWLYENYKDVLQKEWQALVSCARDFSTVIWRSAGLVNDFIDPIRVKLDGQDAQLGELLSYNTELAHKLHARDRVHTYGSFYIATVSA